MKLFKKSFFKRKDPLRLRDDSDEVLSYGALIRIAFMRNRLAVLGLGLIIFMYAIFIPAEFTAPYPVNQRNMQAINMPPQRVRFVDDSGHFSFRPFVHPYELVRDPLTFERQYSVDTSEKHFLRLFVQTTPYEFLGVTLTRRLIGVRDGYMYLLGTDHQGRDVLSRMIYGGRVSLSVGFIGVGISLVLGVTMGMLSGYVGGTVDHLIQRGVEILMGFPSLPLWMAFSAAVPDHWSSIQVFFAMTVILSLIGWGGLCRIVRGMTMSLKNEEFVQVSLVNGANTWWIIKHHLLSGNLSYVIVSATLAIPGMILGETALSFLGLGIQPPMVSWGTLLQRAQDITVLSEYPWQLMPVVFVITGVLCFNFVGDGLRDAIDPMSKNQ